MPKEIADNVTIKNLAFAAVFALLSWGVYTIQQLAISTVALSQSVEHLVVENLPNRVTALEIVVVELQRDVFNLSE